MAKSRKGRRLRAAQRNIVCVAAEDVEAARRVLALLSGAEELSGQPGPPSDSRGPLVGRARFALALRQRRLELLGGDFSAQPPFDMLLALYISEGTDEIITVTRVAALASATLTTALRWLDHLVKNGWVDRWDVPEDARKWQVTLTDKSRQALDQLFS